MSVVVRDVPALYDAAAAWIAERMQEALGRGACSIALAGGGTPRPVYARLAAPPLAGQVDWSRVSVFFGDERAVPADHSESNFRSAHDVLLAKVPIPPGHVHRMGAEKADKDAAARAYERILPDALDVLVLGMGEDGHTASLFPGAPALRERDRRVLAVTGPKPPHERLTITPPVIAKARAVAMIVTGAPKAPMVARALAGDRDVPAHLARQGTWFLDPDAAGALPPGSR